MKKVENVNFYTQNAVVLAQKLLGKYLCLKKGEDIFKAKITETEAYLGKTDSASHAYKGKTNRNSVMFQKGGVCYVYLCYGIHNLLNIVSGEENDPQAVLIRSVEGLNGPGKVTKELGIDRTFNGKSLLENEIWIEDGEEPKQIEKLPRVGIGYAKQEDQEKLWRFRI